MQVLVRDNNVDQALRALKKKMQREGVFREMKLRRNYEKPSERRITARAAIRNGAWSSTTMTERGSSMPQVSHLINRVGSEVPSTGGCG